MNRIIEFEAEVLEHAEEVSAIFLSFIPFSIPSIFFPFQIVQYFLFLFLSKYVLCFLRNKLKSLVEI